MPAKNTPATVWSRIDRSGGPEACWPWTGYIRNDGYGEFIIDGEKWMPHRWVLRCVELRGRVVMHTCDNPPCGNPAHLRVGSQADNLADMRAKGRARPLVGTRAAGAKLTAEQVRAIRSSMEPTRVLAERHGVGVHAIRHAQAGRTYRDVR